MTHRKYSIPLPYETSAKDALAIEAGLGRPEIQAAMKRLPAALQAKIESVGIFHPVQFTEADFNQIPDDLWRQLAPHLG